MPRLPAGRSCHRGRLRSVQRIGAALLADHHYGHNCRLRVRSGRVISIVVLVELVVVVEIVLV